MAAAQASPDALARKIFVIVMLGVVAFAAAAIVMVSLVAG